MLQKISIVGNPRAGNHALTHWLATQYSKHGGVIHYNNVRPSKKYKTCDLNKTCAQKWTYGNGIIKYQIASFENQKLQDVIDTGQAYFNVIVLRDPFNWLASCLKSGMNARFNFYKEYLMEVIQGNHNFIGWIYNKWIESTEYRKKFAKKIGVEYSEDGLNDITSFGGGSSFDKCKMDGMADQMDVMNRWKHYADYKPYLQIFRRRPDIVELSRTFFNFLPKELEEKL